MSSTTSESWQKRGFLSAALRVVIVGVPIAACIATGWLLSQIFPPPNGIMAIAAWLVALLAVSMAVLFVVERLARRLIPLAWLLRLTLIFPDRAPSRFRIALRSGSVGRLREWARNADPSDGDPSSRLETALTLVTALNVHDRKTYGHSLRTAALADIVGEEMGLDESDRNGLRWSALLHDVGKLMVPETLLNKPGAPDKQEWEILHRHPAEGARIVAPIRLWLGDWVDGIGQHHERWDGTGYPEQLSGSSIALAGRVVNVVDSFETMTAVRSYKKPMSPRAARAEVLRCSGSQFDPDVVRSLLGISLGRLHWVIGPAAWIAQWPIVGVLPRAGASLASATSSVAATTGVVASAAALTLGTVLVPSAAAADGANRTKAGAVTSPNGTRAREGSEQSSDGVGTGAGESSERDPGRTTGPSPTEVETAADPEAPPPAEENGRGVPGGPKGSGAPGGAGLPAAVGPPDDVGTPAEVGPPDAVGPPGSVGPPDGVGPPGSVGPPTSPGRPG